MAQAGIGLRRALRTSSVAARRAGLRSCLAWTALIASVELLALGPDSSQASFPGDNGRIVYVKRANLGGDGHALVASKPSGGGRTVLRRLSHDGCVGNPAYSPDGGMLALDTCDSLATMRADGSGFLQLPRFSQPEGPNGFYYANDSQPAWSPDGARLVFVSEAGYDDGFQPYESRRLAIVNADGSGARGLTGEDVADPQWSSRGMIAFTDSQAIWVIRPDGSGRRRVVGRAEHAAWSPDGRSIAFARSKPHFAVSAPGSRICVTSLDGKRVRTVARGFYPAWSPNGRRLAFIRSRPRPGGGLSFAIYTVRLDGSDRRLVTRSRQLLVALDWQPLS
jgi:Tol biopolymer transport system component